MMSVQNENVYSPGPENENVCPAPPNPPIPPANTWLKRVVESKSPIPCESEEAHTLKGVPSQARLWGTLNKGHRVSCYGVS